MRYPKTIAIVLISAAGLSPPFVTGKGSPGNARLTREQASAGAFRSPASVKKTPEAASLAQASPASTTPSPITSSEGKSPATAQIATAPAASTAAGPIGSTATAIPDSSGPDLSPAVLAQIGALQNEKSLRTPVQRRVNSNLLLGAKREDPSQKEDPATQNLQTNLKKDPAGRVLVDIQASITDAFQR